MDYIEGIAKQASQLTMYDVKSYYNQAKNMVLNVSEMEAKVREATNDDPWGASSTLMQQIADGTHNFAQFNEIMPTIYSRFMEKEAREWRQIYKALTLLEFLVKNGSERVVDDARAHVSTIKMLRSFHYIDEKGKDQGINVRNRSSEIALLLGDVERIRQERRKSKTNKTKYQGTGNDGGMSFVTAGGGRYGGFGSDSLGGGGGGGGGGGSNYEAGFNGGNDYRTSSRGFDSNQTEYDEYEGADDFDEQPSRRTHRASASTSRTTSRSSAPPKPVAKEAKPVEKPKEVNLFDFGDDDEPLAAPAQAAAPLASADDDFDDFQQAPSTSSAPSLAPAVSPKPAGNANANLFDMLGSGTAPTQSHQPRAPSLSGPLSPPIAANVPNYSGFTSAPPRPAQQQQPSYTSAVSSPPPKAGASTFDDLFAASLSSLGGKSTPAGGAAAGGRTIKDLEKEKAANSLWGSSTQQTQSQAKPAAQGQGQFDDLLF